MADPIRKISPNTSPYRSKIQTRLASPGSSATSLGLQPSIPRSRSVDCYAVSNEKLQLKKLNDQFLSYIERVRLFETYNHCLTLHTDQIKNAQERIRTKLESLKQEFDEFQQERIRREEKDVALENQHTDQIEQQVDDYKTKQKFYEREHEDYRNQIIHLQKQCIEVQAKTEQLRCDYDHSAEDIGHYRKRISYYQVLKSSLVDDINRQRDLRHRLEIEVDDLKTQKQLNIQAHEADTQALQIHHDNILYDLTNSFRLDGHGKNVLTQMLNEIRDEYRAKDREMRDELHRKYLYEYNQHVKKNQEQQYLESNREEFERRQLTNELNSLNDHRTLLKQKLTMIQEHHQQLASSVQREVQRKKNMEDKYEEQINQMHRSIRDYENLLIDGKLLRSATLVEEVNKYRQLLEGSEQQIGLRQLLHMSTSIDQHRPPSRSTTPPPFPRPPSPSPPPPSAFPRPAAIDLPQPPPLTTLLIADPPRTRQNSTSETSFDTAPASQITSNSNPSYATLNSVPNPTVPADYDTDNDQSQTVQDASGRQSRRVSETDLTPKVTTPTNQETLPLLPTEDSSHVNESVVEIPIETNEAEVLIDQTLPFVPMNHVPSFELDGIKENISEEQQSPVISTVEQREEEQQGALEPSILIPSGTIIPITIDIDSKPVEEVSIVKIVSPTTPTIPVAETEKPNASPPPPEADSNPTETAASVTAEPVVTTVSPLAKLISNMLPNAPPFVPSSNGNANGPTSPTPPAINSVMNNDAPPFIPIQQQHMTPGNQAHMNHQGGSHWGNRGSNSGGGNRRGQGGGGGYHHGGGNQRSGGGGNWQSGGGGHHKQRRGMK